MSLASTVVAAAEEPNPLLPDTAEMVTTSGSTAKKFAAIRRRSLQSRRSNHMLRALPFSGATTTCSSRPAMNSTEATSWTSSQGCRGSDPGGPREPGRPCPTELCAPERVVAALERRFQQRLRRRWTVVLRAAVRRTAGTPCPDWPAAAAAPGDHPLTGKPDA